MPKKNPPLKKNAVQQQPKTLSRYARYTPVVLGVFFLIYYFDLLVGNVYLWEDILEQMYPNLTFTLHSFKKGVFPFWTPYVFGGMPFFADVLTTIFYPPHWILFLFSFFTDSHSALLSSYVAFHVLWMGIGVYALSMHLGLKRVAALFTAVAFMFTGYVSLHIIHATYIYVMSWFPLTMLFLDKSFRTGKIQFVLIAALLFGISALGGYPQPNLHIAYLLFGWTLVTMIQNRKASKRMWVFGLYYCLFMGLGVGLAAIQFLPSVELMQQSVRQALDFEQASIGSIPPSRLLTFIMPKFFGFISGTARQAAYWGFPQQSFLFWETNAFAGIVTLLLAIRAFFDIRRKPIVLYFSIIALIALGLSLGRHTPLWYLVYNYVPGFHSFRTPGRFISWFSFMIVLLGGIGLDALLRSENRETERRYFRTIAVVSGVISAGLILFLSGVFVSATEYFQYEAVLKNSNQSAAVALFSTVLCFGLITLMIFRGKRVLIGATLVFFVFIELYAFGHTFGGSRTRFEQYYRTDMKGPIDQKLQEGAFRVQSRLYRGAGKGEMLLPRNVGNVAMLPMTEGYNQFILSRYSDLLNYVDESVSQKLLNVRFKKVPKQPAFYELERVPRFYCSPFVKNLSNRDSVQVFMNSGEFIAGRDILLEQEPVLRTDTVSGGQYSVRLLSETPNRIEVEVTTEGNTYLSVSEMYYPAWKAYVNGKRTEIVPANLAFRAIPLQKGTHTVVMQYQSEFFLAGMIMSIVVLLLIGYLLWEKMPVPALIRKPWLGA